MTRAVQAVLATPLSVGALAVLLGAVHPPASVVPRASDPSTPSPRREIAAELGDVRGITISCWRWGYEWAGSDMRDVMATLPDVGANWLTIHPYAHVSRETGRVKWSPDERTDHIANPIRWARELGLKIMIKPHISYWGEFSWRGEVGWDDAERWERFRASYHDWILHLARVAAAEGADLFVVGTELRKAESMVEYWQKLIADVRKVYSGPLTYAANWDDFDRVEFWPQLDYVGVQAYFPLTTSEEPDLATLREGWREPIASMKRLSDRVSKPVLLTEVGYPNAKWAAHRPWETSRDRVPLAVQARCLRVALEIAATNDHIAGAFIWKWFPTTRDIGPQDFTVQTADFKQLLREAWSRGLVDQPAPKSTHN